MVTLEEIAERLDVLEKEVRGEKGLTDQRRALTTILERLDDTRARMSKAEIHLEDIGKAIVGLTASQAEMRGALGAEINSVRTELRTEIRDVKADVASLRRDLPSMIADTMREVLRENKG